MFCIYVFSVLAHSELATYTWGLQYNRDTLQWPGGRTTFRAASNLGPLPWTVYTGMLDHFSRWKAFLATWRLDLVIGKTVEEFDFTLTLMKPLWNWFIGVYRGTMRKQHQRVKLHLYLCVWEVSSPLLVLSVCKLTHRRGSSIHWSVYSKTRPARCRFEWGGHVFHSISNGHTRRRLYTTGVVNNLDHVWLSADRDSTSYLLPHSACTPFKRLALAAT